jgi:hypothetical protein
MNYVDTPLVTIYQNANPTSESSEEDLDFEIKTEIIDLDESTRAESVQSVESSINDSKSSTGLSQHLEVLNLKRSTRTRKRPLKHQQDSMKEEPDELKTPTKKRTVRNQTYSKATLKKLRTAVPPAKEETDSYIEKPAYIYAPFQRILGKVYI